MIGNLVGDVFELDSRIWRTVRLLVVRPGSLTVEYLAGRRASYLPPLRLFMATGIIMLLAYSLSGNSLLQIQGGVGVSGEEDPAVEAIEDPEGSEEAEVDAGGTGDAIDASATGGDAGDEEAPEAADAPDVSARFFQAVERRVSQDPEGIQEAFGENMPRMMFLFLPLAAGMLLLLYLGSGRRYVEHLVFSLHAHAFVFLELSVARTLRTWVVGEDTGLGVIVALGAVVWTLVYFFLALRRVFEQSRLVTSIKFVVLVGGYGILLTTLLALTAIVTVFLPA